MTEANTLICFTTLLMVISLGYFVEGKFNKINDMLYQCELGVTK